MPSAKHPLALTIAGSDPCGGAGLQADLRVFDSLGVRGRSVVAAVTAQNSKRLSAVEGVRVSMVQQQLLAVFEGQKPRAAKTGMLLTAGNVEVIVDFFSNKRIPLVVDPVMVSTTGSDLVKPSAWKLIQKKLLPIASLITPNISEAEALTGLTIREPEAMREAARLMQDRFGCGVLLKGGHLRGLNEALDVLRCGRDEWLLSAPRIRGRGMHGSGCVYSAAITAGLANGLQLVGAVKQGKEFVTQEIDRNRNK